MGHFVEVCISLEVNADKSELMVLNGEEGLKCDWSMCQNLNTWIVFWMNHEKRLQAEGCRKGASGRKVADAIKSLVCLWPNL